MAPKGPLLAILCLAAAATAAAAQMPSMAPAPSPSGESPAMSPETPHEQDCETLAVDNMADCLDYVASGSNETNVDEGCCSGFSSVIKLKPLCLCEFVSKNSTFADYLDVNRSKAFTLPNVCRVTIPPVSLCSAAGYEMDIPGIPSSPPLDKCAGVVVKKMVACISYVQKGSNATRPDEECCSGYSTLVDSNPDCLCKLASNPTAVLPGFNISIARAVSLPSKCNAEFPDCNGGGPAAAPGAGSTATPPPESSAIQNVGGPFNVLVASSLLGLSLAF